MHVDEDISGVAALFVIFVAGILLVGFFLQCVP
jgi:hypothetical protein